MSPKKKEQSRKRVVIGQKNTIKFVKLLFQIISQNSQVKTVYSQFKCHVIICTRFVDKIKKTHTHTFAIIRFFV
jgi:hypothetical protein